jgi:DNA-3-methyladenine glycosylase II
MTAPSSDHRSDRTAQPPHAATRAALRHLCRADARLARLIRRVGPYCPAITRDPFLALVGSVVHQQVSMSAAAAILTRLRHLCGGRLTPAAILRRDEDELRTAGLSRQKAAYLRNIADAFGSRTLTSAKLRRMSDEEVIRAATAIKGVGRWTAEMLLIFCLQRPDVWPVDDFGLRKALRDFLGWSEVPAPATVGEVGDRWRPYRSYATWYLWRSLEGPIPPRVAP